MSWKHPTAVNFLVLCKGTGLFIAVQHFLLFIWLRLLLHLFVSRFNLMQIKPQGTIKSLNSWRLTCHRMRSVSICQQEIRNILVHIRTTFAHLFPDMHLEESDSPSGDASGLAAADVTFYLTLKASSSPQLPRGFDLATRTSHRGSQLV